MTASPRQRAAQPKSLIKWVVEVFSIVTAASFVVSALFNSLIFMGWGFSFLGVASTTDIITSGLSLALKFSIALPILIVVARHRPNFWAFMLITAVSGIATYAVVVQHILRFPGYTIDLAHPGVLAFLTSLVPISFVVVIVTYGSQIGDASQRRTVQSDMTEAFRSARFLMAVVSVGLLFGILLVTQQNGYVGNGAVLETEPSSSCEKPQVLWIGDSSLIARCADRRMLLLKGAENAKVLFPRPFGT